MRIPEDARLTRPGHDLAPATFLQMAGAGVVRAQFQTLILAAEPSV